MTIDESIIKAVTAKFPAAHIIDESTTHVSAA